MLEAKLVVVGGDAKSTEVRLKLPTIIGRGKEASLTVPHALVSRRHTEIFEQSGKLFVRDLGSLNGTFVNNTRIEGDQLLKPNQLLTLGNITFRAVYEIEASETAEADQVKFEEVAAGKVPVEEKSPSITEVVSFDETVPIDSIPKSKETPKSPKRVPAAPTPEKDNPPAVVQPEQPANEVADPAAQSVSKTSDETVNVFETVVNVAGTSDTDKSFAGLSSVDGEEFGLDTDQPDPASQSVSANALEDLPDSQPQLSFVGGIDLDGDKASLSQVDAVEIDLGGEEPKDDVDVDSSLGSFLKKLPK